MVLSDTLLNTHRDELFLEEIDDNQIQAASIDLTLHPIVRQLVMGKYDLSEKSRSAERCRTEQFDLNELPNGLALKTGSLVLVSTCETVHMPSNMMGIVKNKSSLCRMGLDVGLNAGLIDPGFQGQITLSVINHGPLDVILRPRVAFCQIVFLKVTGLVRQLYGDKERQSKYQNQQGATAARPKPRQ